MKIGMIGAAGSGRTTVAQDVSREFSLPFISSHSITRPVLVRDGYDYSKGYVEYFLGPREMELIKTRIEIENSHSDFVTDRTVLDQFAYLLLSLQYFSVSDVAKVEKICRNHMKSYTHLFYFPRPVTVLKNGVRTDNVLFQTMVDYVILGLLDDWSINVVKCKESSKIIESLRA